MGLDLMALATTRRWTRSEYEQLVHLGVFRPDERLELLDGVLVVREPQGSAHVTAVALAIEALRIAFGPGWFVRGQFPVALDDDSEPEPDVAVVPGSPRDYRDGHPAQPVLIVEVADTSYRIDRQYKASLYARGGVPEYWIVHLAEGTLEVHQQPVPAAAAPCGWRYGDIEVRRPPATVAPVAARGATVVIADLLP